MRIDTDSYIIFGKKYGLPSQKCGMSGEPSVFDMHIGQFAEARLGSIPMYSIDTRWRYALAREALIEKSHFAIYNGTPFKRVERSVPSGRMCRIICLTLDNGNTTAKYIEKSINQLILRDLGYGCNE